ncbi:MAG: GGDEF domain-containing protein [Campylobacteraceae bacterium]|nr:GGDEF domain-containing protein [Campylobacteraceae bacterium]
MKKNMSTIDTVYRIGDEAFKKLKSLSVPPYPKYYYETFMDLLHESENSEIVELSKKYSYLFTLEGNTQELVENSVSIAKESLKHFQDSSNTIRHFSDASNIELSNYQETANHSQSSGLLALFSSFQNQVLNELQSSEETIAKLKRKIEILERESNIDSLTKAYNRKALLEDLGEILKFGDERVLDLHLALLDADNFKNINDQFGHIAGDKTLIYITKLLQNSLRRGTRVYRYGGEEFVILLNRVNYKDAIKTIERVLVEISESKLFYKGNNIRLTLSAGLSTHRKNDTPEDLIDRADKALYRAKIEGKNCLREA